VERNVDFSTPIMNDPDGSRVNAKRPELSVATDGRGRLEPDHSSHTRARAIGLPVCASTTRPLIVAVPVEADAFGRSRGGAATCAPAARAEAIATIASAMTDRILRVRRRAHRFGASTAARTLKRYV
jgi:hypothetical protein